VIWHGHHFLRPGTQQLPSPQAVCGSILQFQVTHKPRQPAVSKRTLKYPNTPLFFPPGGIGKPLNPTESAWTVSGGIPVSNTSTAGTTKTELPGCLPFCCIGLHQRNYRMARKGLSRMQSKGGSQWANRGAGESNRSIPRPLLQLPRCTYCPLTSSCYQNDSSTHHL